MSRKVSEQQKKEILKLFQDGQKVKDISKDEIKTEVVVGGSIRSNKGINLPDVVLNTSPLTSKDIEDLRFILNQELIKLPPDGKRNLNKKV